MSTLHVYLVLLTYGSTVYSTINTLDLNGIWDVVNINRGIRISGEVPGSVYTALINNKTIGDPYYRDNDVQYRWIGRENWTYTRLFYVASDILSKNSIVLVTEGLDTFATISINEHGIASTGNMFLQNAYDIKTVLKTGMNNITIQFISAVLMAEELRNKSAYPIPPGCPNPSQHGECYRNFIRKEQCSFSWDWGPSFPGQGIWKNISIQHFNQVGLRLLTATPIFKETGWVVSVTLHLYVSFVNVTGQVQTYLEKTGVFQKHSVSLATGLREIAYTFKVPEETQINLWWPNGYGEQSLYSLTVKFTTDTGDEAVQKSIQIGFRTLELIQEPVSKDLSQGLTFYYKINNVPIFFKGTNWIPSDSFLERVTKTRLEQHLRSAKEVHINSMRVWGGGVYESDEFYRLCDELGIMLWQDLMFSDALYPVTTDFLGSVQMEVQQQIERLKYHPSIVVWSANNENEGIVTGQKDQRYKTDYVELYIKIIMPVVALGDVTRPFIPSSPTNGVETKSEGWIAKNPGSEFYGDDHFYNYNADLWDSKSFPTPRFASEFGSEAWCNFETIEKVFDEGDLDYNSAMANHRQHHENGNVEMLNQTRMHITLPTSSDPKQNFQDLIYVIQIHQAMAIRTEAEKYRRFSNELLSDGRGLTMGALYWQLNDIWQAPTWASIDYDIRWKMLHYYVRKFFDPNLISPYVDGNNLYVYMVLDEIPSYRDFSGETQQVTFRPINSLRQIAGAGYKQKNMMQHIKNAVLATEGVVIMELYNWTNMQPMMTWDLPVFNLNQTSGLIFQRNLDDILAEAHCSDKNNCFLYFYLNSKSDPTSTSWLPLTYFTKTQGVIPRATIKVLDVVSVSSTEFTIDITTNNIAPFVWINALGISGRFSDNGFIMKDPLIQLTFTSWQPVDLDTFKRSLSVKSLMDIYH